MEIVLSSGDQPLRLLLVGRLALHPLPRQITLRTEQTLRAAIATFRVERFDCIVVERELEDGDGIVLAPAIRRIHPLALSILVSEHDRWAMVEAAHHLGYSHVISKSELPHELTSIIERYLTERGFGDKENKPKQSRLHLLTLREREILSDIATGATTEEIARKRHNSVATIKSHLTSIYRKLEVRNRVEAIAKLEN